MSDVNVLALLLLMCTLGGNKPEQVEEQWWDRHEIASYLKVKPATVSSYIHRQQFPKHEEFRGRKQVWRRTTIETWRGQQRGSVIVAETVEVRSPDSPREPTVQNPDGTFGHLTDHDTAYGVVQARLDLCEAARSLSESAKQLAAIPTNEQPDTSTKILKQAKDLRLKAEEIIDKAAVYKRMCGAPRPGVYQSIGFTSEAARRDYQKAGQRIHNRLHIGNVEALEKLQDKQAKELDRWHGETGSSTAQGIRRLRLLITLNRLRKQELAMNASNLQQAKQLHRIIRHQAVIYAELTRLDGAEIEWFAAASSARDKAEDLRAYIHQQLKDDLNLGPA
ncbi:hypothetical protein Skr01_74270 [Sphaerisporangium krabiense]|nr:hypothetical protein Skr01_74270 [Sphaerisporangium krabiense]